MTAELRTALFVQAACTPTWHNFLDLPSSYAVHYANPPAYDAFNGTGLGRDMDYMGLYRMSNASAIQLEHLLPLGSVKIGTCSTEASDGTWHTQRIGPFRSHGGYDWWQFSWNDVLGLQRLLEEGADVGITAHFSGPVDEQGNPIPLPPIHVHHLHLKPWDRSVTPFSHHITEGILYGSAYDPAFLIQHHGDHQYLSQDGGTHSFGATYEQHPKLFGSPLAMFCEFNDVRPEHSPPMEWWYQIVVRTSPVVNDRPLSTLFTFNPGRVDLGGTQTGLLTLNWLPSTVDSFFYYTGRMPFGGVLLPNLVEVHAHQEAFQSAILFAATPAEIGLGPAFKPSVPWESTVTTTTGVANNSALKAYISRQAPRSSRICDVVGQMEQVGAKWYDRAARVRCVPWTFAAGEILTVVSFNGPRAGSIAGMTGMAPTSKDFRDFPQHTDFFISYLCDDGISHYTSAYYTQELDAMPPFVDRFETLRALLDGGMPRGPPTLADHASVATLTLVIWLATCSIAGKLATLPPLISLGVLLWWWTQARRTGRLRCCTVGCGLSFLMMGLAIILLVSVCVSLIIPDIPFASTKAEQEALKGTDSFKTHQADASAAAFTLLVLSFTMIAFALVWILRNLNIGCQPPGLRVSSKDDDGSGTCLSLAKRKSPLL